MSLIGGEIADLQHLQANLQQQSVNVEDLMAALTADVQAVWWKGPAADRFRAAWESDYQPALRRLAQALVDASTEVRNRANMLIQVGS